MVSLSNHEMPFDRLRENGWAFGRLAVDVIIHSEHKAVVGWVEHSEPHLFIYLGRLILPDS